MTNLLTGKTRSWPVRFCAAVFAAFAGPALYAQPAPTFTNVTVHDPSVVRSGAEFYVFGSHLASAKTTDFMNWTQLSTSPAAGNPMAPNAQVEFSEALTSVGSDTFWAPDVIRLNDGRYYLYYCVGRLDQPRAALGLAVSNSIGGPYSNLGIMLTSGMPGTSAAGVPYNATIHPNTVDPAVFFDFTGNYWMVYGSYSGGIFILAMNPITGLPLAGQGYGKKLIGGNHARIEGAYILYSPESAYYYLFLSFGGLNANDGYNIRVGRSRNPDGPYLDAAGTDLATVAGAPGTLFDDASIAPHGVKLMGSYQFLHVAGEPQLTSRGYRSPGHNSAYYDPATGKHFLVFHTRFVGRGEQHEVRVHQMFMNTDGWLVASPHRYAGETIAPTSTGQVAGDWKLINHGKAISGTVNNSVAISLNADSSVTGAATGTWELSGGRYATLTLGGTTYRGVFVRQWDDDNLVWVLTFSALSNNGVAVWGSKVAALNVDVPPSISSQPASQTVAAGGTVVFSVEASGTPAPTYQWRKDGVAISGATSPLLVLRNLTAGSAGGYTCTVTNDAGSISSTSAALTVVSTGDPGRLTALSIRGQVGTGGDVMIAGIIVENSTVQTLIQAVGPTLGVIAPSLAPTVLVDPNLELYRLVNGSFVNTLQGNNDWNGSPAIIAAEAAAGATALTNTTSKDSSLLATLSPGVYTANVNGVGSTTGVALLQAYAVPSATDTGTLAALSIRGRVGTGGDIMIAGLIISGSTSKTLLIQAVGPTLGVISPDLASSVLNDTKLELYQLVNGSFVKIRTNEDWGGDPQIATIQTAAGATGLPNSSSRDSALLVTLPPGVYTANVSGVNNTGGVVLLQAYAVP
ncbi:MAG TPA: glycoside hydrolase family 43 C-terminal domain-containing protein [Opitutaceae bacterium]|nr:glycoside hydrolase family 43 C-terminal domain-containing protein [Opitutaceae bacterium]